MDAPGIVRRTVGDEPIAADVTLGGEDTVYVTPTRTLLHRAEGLLSDESVEEFPHTTNRIETRDGRRKTTVVLEYPEETREFTVPDGSVDAVLKPLLAGVLHAGAITADGETVRGVYRFSELTLVVTDRRLVKHVGTAVWDDEHEEYDYERVTGLAFEEGSVATQIVVEVEGRPQRIKAPNRDVHSFRTDLESAVFDFHGVASAEELAALHAEAAGTGDAAPADAAADGATAPEGGPTPDGATAPGGPTAPGDAGVEAGAGAADGATGGMKDLLDAGSVDPEDGPGSTVDLSLDLGGDDASDETPTVDSPTDDDRLTALTAAVERQNDLLERQQETLEQLVAELRRGR